MTPENFAYWLQGFFEISESNHLSEKQVLMIKNHLNLVFYHSIDPKATEGMPPAEAEKKQQVLNEIHAGKSHLHGDPSDPYLKFARC